MKMESPNDLYNNAKTAVRILKSDNHVLGDFNPKVMLVLGSGCGDVADNVEATVRVDYGEIMGMPSSTVKGHAGKFIAGNYGGKDVVAFSGRNHFYEGNSAQQASYMIYVAHHFGAKVAIMTAAAGIAPDY